MILRYSVTSIAILLFSTFYLLYDNTLSSALQWQLISGKTPELFTEFIFLFATLPRLAMALMVGAVLGLVGSLLQQITRNPLLSPLTLGTSAGAWLALIIISIAVPSLAPDLKAIVVMIGSMLAMGLVLLIAGFRELAGLRVILAGMAVNILLGAITSAIIILRDQYAKNLFIWGAGDLAQNDWQWMIWLAPKLIIAVVILAIAPRVLQLLRLGQSGARSLGLATTPVLIVLFAAALWLMSATITAVGIISFIGLIAPNIARLLGANNARDQLYYSTLLGALLLLLADFVARIASNLTIDIIPSGTATAIIGAPMLIYLAMRGSRAEDQMQISQNTVLRSQLTLSKWLGIIGIAVFALIVAMFLNNDGVSWRWNIPSDFEIATRTPRILIALAAGICMAVAGTVLQRLINNPLASPDLLGVSAGATAAIVISSLLTGQSLFVLNPLIALTGSAVMLAILVLLTRAKQFSGGTVLLLGISLTAMVEALVQFVLAKGSQDVYTMLSWLAGSSYNTELTQSLWLFAASILIMVLSLISARSLTLLNLSTDIAAARGLKVSLTTNLLLALVALSCALVTASLGPIAFIGLLAPHMAQLMGARKVKSQLLLSAALGGVILILADWLGRNILFPSQVAAGTLAAALGGGYFVILLLKAKVSRHSFY